MAGVAFQLENCVLWTYKQTRQTSRQKKQADRPARQTSQTERPDRPASQTSQTDRPDRPDRHRLPSRQTDQTDRHRLPSRQTDQTDRQTQTAKQTDRQADRWQGYVLLCTWRPWFLHRNYFISSHVHLHVLLMHTSTLQTKMACCHYQQSTRRPRNLFHLHDRVTSSKLVRISNELNARWTFKHWISQLASLLRRYLRDVLRYLSIVSSWCFYFCWLLRVVVEVALTRKI